MRSLVAYFPAFLIYLVLILKINLLKNSSRRHIEEAEKTREWQTSEREAQNDWNYKLWQANNEYNTPAAVQARLEAAGINPDLYVTNGRYKVHRFRHKVDILRLVPQLILLHGIVINLLVVLPRRPLLILLYPPK